jgi:hypothetical protein
MLLRAARHRGRRVNANWDTLGMRATRSDALILRIAAYRTARLCAPTTPGGSAATI